LAAAQDAVSKDPSEVNVRRLETARDRLANAEAIAYLGRGAMVGTGLGEVKAQLKYAPPRPNIAAAEAERGRLDRLLAEPAVSPRSRAARARPRNPDGTFKGE
jgi:hypothetical protein